MEGTMKTWKLPSDCNKDKLCYKIELCEDCNKAKNEFNRKKKKAIDIKIES